MNLILNTDSHKASHFADHGKRSKRGRLALVMRGGRYGIFLERETLDGENRLMPVFRDGELLVDWSLDDIASGRMKRSLKRRHLLAYQRLAE